jgi:hypothetical protein
MSVCLEPAVLVELLITDEAVASCWASAGSSEIREDEAGASCWAIAGSCSGEGGEANASIMVVAGSPGNGEIEAEAVTSSAAVGASRVMVVVIAEAPSEPNVAPSEPDDSPWHLFHSGPRDIVEASLGSSTKSFFFFVKVEEAY